MLNEIGRGSSSIVFQAVHLELQRNVAIKIPLTEDPTQRQLYADHFRMEARLMALVDHPHVVRIHDFEEHGDWPYLVMEYIKGVTLDDLLRQSGRMRWDNALRMIRQVTLGLHAIARVGLVHRDVKPANILIGRDGAIKLTDLGLALNRNHARDPECDDDAPIGTAAYMAPEQANPHSDIDSRADIYSLGVVFYHVLAGHMPYHAISSKEMIRLHRESEPPPLEYAAPEIPDSIVKLVRRMMAKNPAERPPTLDALWVEIRKLEARLTQPASPVNPLDGPLAV
ncbi:serine/threonine-protein kinase [Tuwongella immobilis]|nr:serine/threonine-protein kinase [Tuwongella immobilis]